MCSELGDQVFDLNKNAVEIVKKRQISLGIRGKTWFKTGPFGVITLRMLLRVTSLLSCPVSPFLCMYACVRLDKLSLNVHLIIRYLFPEAPWQLS